MDKSKLNKIKSYLITLQLDESDSLKVDNINHLIYSLDELILDKNRISFEEVLDDFKTYSEYIYEIRVCYYILKSLKTNEV